MGTHLPSSEKCSRHKCEAQWALRVVQEDSMPLKTFEHCGYIFFVSIRSVLFHSSSSAIGDFIYPLSWQKGMELSTVTYSLIHDLYYGTYNLCSADIDNDLCHLLSCSDKSRTKSSLNRRRVHLGDLLINTSDLPRFHRPLLLIVHGHFHRVHRCPIVTVSLVHRSVLLSLVKRTQFVLL